MPPSADAIFVFAGRESRKRTGLRLFLEGAAPVVVFSVGRFEWRRFAALGLEDDGGLVELVQTIEPRKRHFFVHVGPEGASSEPVTVGRYGTWTEARALAGLAEREGYQKILVVSHPEHLPRCLLSLSVFLPPEATVVPVAADEPERVSRVDEMLKLAGYRLLAAVERLRRPARACAGSGILL